MGKKPLFASTEKKPSEKFFTRIELKFNLNVGKKDSQKC